MPEEVWNPAQGDILTDNTGTSVKVIGIRMSVDDNEKGNLEYKLQDCDENGDEIADVYQRYYDYQEWYSSHESQ